MLFNEPKLLKFADVRAILNRIISFSALQRAEIAEIGRAGFLIGAIVRFSALQRAEIAEIGRAVLAGTPKGKFQCSSTSRNC